MYKNIINPREQLLYKKAERNEEGLKGDGLLYHADTRVKHRIVPTYDSFR
jgi:hypothetical protein